MVLKKASLEFGVFFLRWPFWFTHRRPHSEKNGPEQDSPEIIRNAVGKLRELEFLGFELEMASRADVVGCKRENFSTLSFRSYAFKLLT